MKFPRNAKILRSEFDFAPFAAVFFALIIFLWIGVLAPVPGVPVSLPMTENLPGANGPMVAVAISSTGQFFFDNKIVLSEAELKLDLLKAVKNSRGSLTLLINADKAATYEQLLRLTMLARDAGILNAQLATLPRVTDLPAQ